MRALWLLLCLIAIPCHAKEKSSSQARIGYVLYRQCLSTHIAVKRFCTHPKLRKSSLKCKNQSTNAFALQARNALDNSIDCSSLQLPKAHSQRKDVDDFINRIAENVREQTGCRLIFYAPSAVVKDGEGDTPTMRRQPSPPAHLDRLDQRRLPLDGQFYWNATGRDVTVFLLDSVALSVNVAFTGNAALRAFEGTIQSSVIDDPISFVSSLRIPETHQNSRRTVASNMALAFSIASSGVAKRVALIDVSTLPCRSQKAPLYSTLSILEGLKFVDSNARKFSPAILLLPFHFRGIDPGVEDMIERIIGKDVIVITSSGKQGSCAFTPARMKDVLTVGASDLKDRAMHKGDASCIDVFAPGRHIRAASARSNNAFRSTAGSSFAAAIVTGVAATILERHPQMSPERLKNEIAVNYTTHAISTSHGKKSLTPSEKRSIRRGVHIVEDSPDQPQSGFSVQPLRPPIINLFKNTTDATKDLKMHISNYGKGELVWGMMFESIHSNMSPTWMEGTIMNGSLSTGERMEVDIHFTSASDSAGFYQAFISMSSNDPKLHSLRIPIETRIFCQELLNHPDRYEMNIEDAQFFEKRPPSWDPPALIEPSDLLYMEAVLTFSQPVTLWDLSECNTDGMSSIEYATLLNNELCGKYEIRMTRKKLDAWEGVNAFCLMFEDNTIFDIHGKPFPKQSTCAHYNAEPKSRIYGSFLTTGSGFLPKTMYVDIDLVLTFSENVIGFNASSLKVTEGTITSVTPTDPSETSYFVRLQLEEHYYGLVTVSLSGSDITDVTGVPLANEANITFERVKGLRFLPATLHFEI